MELFRELLLTAAVSLLVAFLLARLFGAANDPRREPHREAGPGPAAVIAEEKEEEERIIEVDEVKVKEARVGVAAEGWVEVGKASAEGKPDRLPEEEGAPGKTARELFLGAVLEEHKEEGQVGEERSDLTAAAAAREMVVEVKPHDLGVEAAHCQVLDVGVEKQMVQDVGVERHGLGAEVASETVPVEVLCVVSEKQEEQAIEEKQQELFSEAAPRTILDVSLTEKEELKEEGPVEEAGDVHEEVQSKDEAKCEAHPVDQQEGLVSQEELVVRKIDHEEVIHESSSNDKVVAELPEEEATLQGVTTDDSGTDMEFAEWEGIERSEVEKRFGEAAAFATSDAGMSALSKLDSGVQLQLQGLLKVAIDGPCYDSTQPLTLRSSSRAKWVAWQKLGNMHPEIAMEKYMNLLSETIPGWTGDDTLDTEKHEAGGDSGGPVLTMTSHTSDPHTNQGNEDSTEMDDSNLASSPNPEKGRSSDIPAE